MNQHSPPADVSSRPLQTSTCTLSFPSSSHLFPSVQYRQMISPPPASHEQSNRVTFHPLEKTTVLRPALQNRSPLPNSTAGHRVCQVARVLVLLLRVCGCATPGEEGEDEVIALLRSGRLSGRERKGTEDGVDLIGRA